jgi:hypothetical protein
MIDRTVKQAATAGIRTQPVATAPKRRPNIPGPIFTPALLADALNRARAMRIEDDIQAYAARKAS